MRTKTAKCGSSPIRCTVPLEVPLVVGVPGNTGVSVLQNVSACKNGKNPALLLRAGISANLSYFWSLLEETVLRHGAKNKVILLRYRALRIEKKRDGDTRYEDVYIHSCSAADSVIR